MKNFQTTIFLIVILILLGFNFRQCAKTRSHNKASQSVRLYDTKAKYYEAKNGELVAYNQSLNTTMKALKQENAHVTDLIENMKITKPTTIVRAKPQTRIDSVFIPYDRPVHIVNDSFTASFRWNDSIWASIDGIVNQDGVLINDIHLYDDILIVVGTKNNGFWKRDEYVVAVHNANPHVYIDELENYNIKPKVRFYDRLWFKAALVGAGVTIGILLSR